MKKSELREKYLKLRKTLSKDEVLYLSQQIFENFVHHFELKSGQNVHIFKSIEKQNEVQTDFFIQYLLKNQINVLVPKVIGDEMISIPLNENTEMSVNKWGIVEPLQNVDAGITDFDFVITPLLYADSNGNRVGFGKGFYDKFFSKINSDCKKIGVGFFNPDELVQDADSYDVPLDYLVTPTEVLSFKGLL